MTQFKPVQDCRIPDLKRMFRHYERRFDVLLKTGFAFLVRQPTLEPFPSSPHFDILFFCRSRNLTTTAMPTMPYTTSTAENSSEKGIANIYWGNHLADNLWIWYLKLYIKKPKPLLILRITVEHARGPRRSDRGRGGRRSWIDKYGPPTRTNYRVIVENLSSRVSWQVSSTVHINTYSPIAEHGINVPVIECSKKVMASR